ncbi:MAG: hypothetical protein K8S87_10120 [Planctomycetes bacterium]|nr:hypothetical protein [Planctomycetota bacterium]
MDKIEKIVKPVSNIASKFGKIAGSKSKLLSLTKFICQTGTSLLPGIGPLIGSIIGSTLEAQKDADDDEKLLAIQDEIEKQLKESKKLRTLIDSNNEELETKFEKSFEIITERISKEFDNFDKENSLIKELLNTMEKQNLESFEEITAYVSENSETLTTINESISTIQFDMEEAMHCLNVIDKKIDEILGVVKKITTFEWSKKELETVKKLNTKDVLCERDGIDVNLFTDDVMNVYLNAKKKVDNKAIHERIAEELFKKLETQIISILESVPYKILFVSNDRTEITMHMLTLFKEIGLSQSFVRKFAEEFTPNFWKAEGNRIKLYYETGSVYDKTTQNIITGVGGFAAGVVVGTVVGSKLKNDDKK